MARFVIRTKRDAVGSFLILWNNKDDCHADKSKAFDAYTVHGYYIYGERENKKDKNFKEKSKRIANKISHK